MPIAIYRHWKLSVVVPRLMNPVVVPLNARRLLGVELQVMGDGSHEVMVRFIESRGRARVRTHYGELWRFNQHKFTIEKSVRRGGRVIVPPTKPQVVAPALTLVWTNNVNPQEVYQQFEREIASRVAIERYLHRNTPNPDDYMIVGFDFNPSTMIDGKPAQSYHMVRELETVEVDAIEDKSESADRWCELFFP